MDKAATACKWARRMPAQSVYLKAEDIGCHREEGLKSWRAEITVCAHVRVSMCVSTGAGLCGRVCVRVRACACTCLCVHPGHGERGKLKDREGEKGKEGEERKRGK